MSSNSEEKLNAIAWATAEDLYRGIRNYVAHGVWSGNLERIISTAAFSIMMKFLNDNEELTGITLPDILKYDVLVALAPDKMPMERLDEFLFQLQLRTGINDGQMDFLSSFKYAGGGFDDKELAETLAYIEGKDLDIRNVGNAALYAVIMLKQGLGATRYTSGIAAYQIDELISKLAPVQDGMTCYSVTDMSLPLSACASANKKCTLYAHNTQVGFVGLNKAILIISSVTNKIITLRNNVEWLPIEIEQDEYNKGFDRIYAVPDMTKDNSVRTTLSLSDNVKCEDYVKWWPEMLGGGQWIYARHIVKSLKDDGVGFLLIPLGQLSRLGGYSQIRQMFALHGMVKAVVEFPVGIISGTMTRMALVMLGKGYESDSVKNGNDYVMMVNLSTNGASELIKTIKGKLTYLAVDEIAGIITNGCEISGISRKVSCMDIADNDGIFSPSSYISQDHMKYLQGKDSNSMEEHNEYLMEELEAIDEDYKQAMSAFLQMRNVWEDNR